MIVMGNAIVSNIGKEMMLPIPLFILMGYFVLVSEIGQDVYKVAHIWLGRLPGGLAQATTVACAGFAACTGDSLGAAATMSSISFPILDKYKYDQRLSTACVAVGGTLGILIPPSIPMITYGFLTSASIGSMFIAGIIPGILVCVCLMVTTGFLCARNPLLGPKSEEKYTLKQKIGSVNAGVWGVLALFLLIIGGLYFGVFTPSEAGAIGAGGAFVITIGRRKLNRKNLYKALKGAGQITCFLFTMIAGAMIFQIMLVMAGFMAQMQSIMSNLEVSPYVVLFVIIVIWLVMGMFMDQMATQLLTVPIFAPIIVDLGFDLIWFGIIAIIISEIGIISPPVGMNCFVVSGTTGVPAREIFKGVIPYCVALLVACALMIVFPEIVLFLPERMS
jgi:tripartite ATP-independent transporter DctM subunit